MPRKSNAVAIARIDCIKCSQRATVYQANNGYLYTRCPNVACKANLSRDEAFQIAVWQRMEPIKGAADDNGVPVVIHRPRNVPESAGDIGGALTGKAPEVTVIEPVVPTPVPENVPTPVPTITEPEPAPAPVKTEKKTVQNRVPAPKGAGTVQPEGKSAAGFWLLLLGLAGGAGWVVSRMQNNNESAQA